MSYSTSSPGTKYCSTVIVIFILMICNNNHNVIMYFFYRHIVYRLNIVLSLCRNEDEKINSMLSPLNTF